MLPGEVPFRQTLRSADIEFFPVGVLRLFIAFVEQEFCIGRKFGAMPHEQMDDSAMIGSGRHPDRAVYSLSIVGADVGAALDQLFDNGYVSVEAGNSERQPGIAVHVGFFDIGPVFESGQDVLKISAFDGSP